MPFVRGLGLAVLMPPRAARRHFDMVTSRVLLGQLKLCYLKVRLSNIGGHGLMGGTSSQATSRVSKTLTPLLPCRRTQQLPACICM